MSSNSTFDANLHIFLSTSTVEPLIPSRKITLPVCRRWMKLFLSEGTRNWKDINHQLKKMHKIEANPVPKMCPIKATLLSSYDCTDARRFSERLQWYKKKDIKVSFNWAQQMPKMQNYCLEVAFFVKHG